MIYLIDGHNLIGKMPDIHLSDPDDEERLVRRLQDWTRLAEKRKVTVYFDAGEGGFGDLMSGLGVQVKFARMGQPADELIIRRLKKVRNAQAFTLVTSDNEILRVARRRRVGYVLSEEFVELLTEELMAADVPDDDVEDDDPTAVATRDDVEVSEHEVAQWLSVFGDVPEGPAVHRREPPQKKRPHKDSSTSKLEPPTNKQRPPATLEELKAGEADVTKEEIEEWMEMFGRAPQPKPREESEKPQPARKRPVSDSANEADDSREPEVGEGQKYADGKLPPEDVALWMEMFGGDDNA